MIKYWIFKIIYYPIGLMIGAALFIIFTTMLKEMEWDAPFNWLVIIGAIAMIADWFVNRGM